MFETIYKQNHVENEIIIKRLEYLLFHFAKWANDKKASGDSRIHALNFSRKIMLMINNIKKGKVAYRKITDIALGISKYCKKFNVYYPGRIFLSIDKAYEMTTDCYGNIEINSIV